MNDPRSLPQSLRFGIAGAGAIGCTVAAMLAHAGNPVSVLARGETLRALQNQGIQLQHQNQTISANVTASDSAQQLGPQDVLFLCTKAQDIGAILPLAQPMIGPDTIVIPLINGVPWWYFQGVESRHTGRAVETVDPQGQLLRALPWQQLLGAVVFITAERPEPGRVISPNPMLIIVGELTHQRSDRAEQVAQALNRAGIEGRVSERIRDPLWVKIIANLTSNPLSVLTHATLDQLYGDPRISPVVRKVLLEGLTLAAAYGARIEFDPETFTAQAMAMGPVRTSMLQDALAGRPLELAAIGDSVLELAALQRIPMPVTQDILGMAHYRDEILRSTQNRDGDKQ